DVLLDDRNSDAVLVMNVETALASADDIAKAVAERASAERMRRGSGAKPLLAVWVGTDRRVGSTFEKAGISHFSTEGGAVRAFMNLVRYREATEALAATPPDVSPIFAPDSATARRMVERALANGHARLDPVEVALLF